MGQRAALASQEQGKLVAQLQALPSAGQQGRPQQEGLAQVELLLEEWPPAARLLAARLLAARA